VIESVPYDAFDALAAFAAAISIAYASLPNFRHKQRMQGHVREAVKKRSVAQVISSNESLLAHECWCILYRLGQLSEEEHPRPHHETDHNFQQRPDFRAFNWLFVTNMDKMIAIALGAIATSVVWFGLLDRMYFPKPILGDYNRIWFLSTVIAFYVITIAIGLLVVLLFKIVAARSLDHAGWRNTVITYAPWAPSAFFLIFFGLSALGVFFFGPVGHMLMMPFQEPPIVNLGGEYTAFIITRTILLTTIAVPLYLLYRGERLSEAMTQEVTRCVTELGVGVIDRAEEPDFNDDSNPTELDWLEEL
jgi:hypothetical protein